jgi:hypothetical protein
MADKSLIRSFGAATFSCAILFAAGPATAATPAQWVTNGGTACQKILTTEITGTILGGKGTVKMLSPQSCDYGTEMGHIAITLKVITPQSFDAFMQYLVDPQPLAGVGDKAFQSMIGITAIKGNRGCDVDADGALKLKGPALGAKLGAICNKLFALP